VEIAQGQAGAAGRYTIPTTSPLADGTYTVTAVQVVGGAASAPSPPMIPLLLINTDPTAGDTPHQRIVDLAALGLLGHELDPTTRAALVARLDQGASTASVIRAIEAMPGYATQQARVAYGLAGLSPTPGALAKTASALAAGRPFRRVEAGLLGSADFFRQAGGTTADFLDALGRDFLGGSVSARLRALAARGKRVAVATAALDSVQAGRAYARYRSHFLPPQFAFAGSGSETDRIARLFQGGDIRLADGLEIGMILDLQALARVADRHFLTKVGRDVLLGQFTQADIDTAAEAALRLGLDAGVGNLVGTITFFPSAGFPGAPPPTVLDSTSVAYREATVRLLFLSYVHRDPGIAGADLFLANLLIAVPPDSINISGASVAFSTVSARSFILTSDEYAHLHPTATGYVNAVYQDIFGRAPTAAELQSVPAHFDPINVSDRFALIGPLLSQPDAQTHYDQGVIERLLNVPTVDPTLYAQIVTSARQLSGFPSSLDLPEYDVMLATVLTPNYF
jgi:hypothetical protein